MTVDRMIGVAGWKKIGSQPWTVQAGTSMVGAAYWRKDFTGTQMTVNGLGASIDIAGLLLCEFSGA